MHFETVWKSDEQFNVEISAKEGAEAFLSIRGCRLRNGNDGEFVSFPANPPKKDGGKWWQHIWANEKFSAAVLEKALASKPGSKRKFTDADADSIPF